MEFLKTNVDIKDFQILSDCIPEIVPFLFQQSGSEFFHWETKMREFHYCFNLHSLDLSEIEHFKVIIGLFFPFVNFWLIAFAHFPIKIFMILSLICMQSLTIKYVGPLFLILWNVQAYWWKTLHSKCLVRVESSCCLLAVWPWTNLSNRLASQFPYV